MSTNMKFDPKELLWENKWRPQTIADCVLPDSTRKMFNGLLKKKDIQNMLLVSTQPGTGKTTTAMCLLNELGYEWQFVAAGTGGGEGGINKMRQLQEFAAGMSITGKRKAILIDEADNLTLDAQKALRNIIEKYTKTVRFILTANYPENLIPPVRSRLKEYVFEVQPDDVAGVKKQMIMRCKSICEAEGIRIDSIKALAAAVSHYYPDNRQVMVNLQSYAAASDGVIDEGLLATFVTSTMSDELFAVFRTRKFSEWRRMAAKYRSSVQQVITELGRNGIDHIQPGQPMLNYIDILSEANQTYSMVADTEILLLKMFKDISLKVALKD